MGRAVYKDFCMVPVLLIVNSIVVLDMIIISHRMHGPSYHGTHTTYRAVTFGEPGGSTRGYLNTNWPYSPN